MFTGRSCRAPEGVAVTGVFIGERSAVTSGSAISADDLATAARVKIEVARRLLPVAQATVEQFAATAPVEVKNEAIIRLAGWINASPPGDLVPTGIGGIDFTWRPGASRNALRNSGAAGLLAPWRRPRGLVV